MPAMTGNGSRLTVLGSCAAWPEPGRASSGFLLEHAGFRIVLDLGFGTLPRLLSALGSVTGDGLDAVVITHAHPDHMVDLNGLFRARRFGRPDAPAIPVYAPDGVLDQVAAIERFDDLDAGRKNVEQALAALPLPSSPYEIGPFVMRSWLLPHRLPNVGVRLTAPGLVVAYPGDTSADPELADLAQDADLFIAGATDRDQQGTPQPGAVGSHPLLTARQAGEAALAAGAKRLLLTHFWPGNDRQQSWNAAAQVFGGDILIAEEGAVIELP
jgi:ribonuclease BN (tRNA processing enzyme)